MSYYSRILGQDEKIAFIGTLSQVIYAPGIAVVLISLAAFAFAGESPPMKDLAFLALAPALIGIGMMAKQLVRQFTTEAVITDRRVILKTGLMAREAKDLSLSRIQGADLIQTAQGRLFGYGDVDVKEVGEGSINFRQLRDPLGFRRVLEESVRSATSSGSPSKS